MKEFFATVFIWLIVLILGSAVVVMYVLDKVL